MDVNSIAGGQESVLAAIQDRLEGLHGRSALISDDIFAAQFDFVKGGDPDIRAGSQSPFDYQGVRGSPCIVLIVLLRRGSDGHGTRRDKGYLAVCIDLGYAFIAGRIRHRCVDSLKDRFFRIVSHGAGYALRIEAEATILLDGLGDTVLQVEVHADSSSAAADLEDVGVVSRRGLVIQNLVLFASIVHLGRAEEERAVGSCGQYVRINDIRRSVDIGKP